MYGILMRAVSAAALACALSAAAQAADLGGSVKDDYGYPAEPRFSWTGVYIGGHAGLIFDGKADYTHRNVNTFGGPGGVYDNSFDGAFGGGQIGANWQVGALVLGVEGTWSGSNASGNLNFAQYANDTTTEINQFYTVVGRLGVTTGRFMFYAKGGFASGEISAGQNYYVAPPNNRTFADSKWADGWTAGAGVEYAVTNTLIAGLEFDHVDLDTVRFSGKDSGGTNTQIDGDLRFSSVMARLSYKFGGF